VPKRSPSCMQQMQVYAREHQHLKYFALNLKKAKYVIKSK